MGRYENGVRHGLGQEVLIMAEDVENKEGVERYKMIPRVYNRGHLLQTYSTADQSRIVTDILSNIDFFGFMGLIE